VVLSAILGDTELQSYVAVRYSVNKGKRKDRKKQQKKMKTGALTVWDSGPWQFAVVALNYLLCALLLTVKDQPCCCSRGLPTRSFAPVVSTAL
jgi:hypothetical protein